MVDGCVLGSYTGSPHSLAELESTYKMMAEGCIDIENQKPAYEAKKKELKDSGKSSKES